MHWQGRGPLPIGGWFFAWNSLNEHETLAGLPVEGWRA